MRWTGIALALALGCWQADMAAYDARRREDDERKRIARNKAKAARVASRLENTERKRVLRDLKVRADAAYTAAANTGRAASSNDNISCSKIV